ncbi:MAG: SPFH domain-containing protein [Acidobacteriota bacterium]|nr:SPFH domain-containing protein [Acidobacteriota bacterium]
MIFVAIAAIVILFFLLRAAIVIVPNDHAYITERMGVYSATLPPGFHVIMPLLDTIRFKHVMSEQTAELSDVIETQDRQRASLTSAYRYRILDPQRASYGSVDYANFLKEVVRTSQKRYVAGQTWDALRQDTRALEAEVQRGVDEASETIGVKLLEYTVRDLQLQG